ncbi:MAG: dTMP kinase [Desulfobacterales bacterium]|jgi:dTMP kinase
MFITLEGIEGSGKTTQLPRLCDFLTARGVDCVVTREPGGTAAGRRIRSILLDPESRGLSPKAELLLYFADRADHVTKVILPALSAGQTVVCDRYVDATIAYQGFARGLGTDLVEALHRLLLDDLKPNLTLLFDLAPEVSLRRALGALQRGDRTAAESRFENEARAFHERVRAGYLELARREPHRYRVIDAANSPEQVTQAMIDAVSSLLD